MNYKILVFLTLSLGVASGSIITNILKELTPLVAGLGQSIEGISKDVGGLIGDTFFNLDRIVGDAEYIIEAKLTKIDLILSASDDNQEDCVLELTTLRNNLNSSALRSCVDKLNVRNSLSQSLVEIGLLRSAAFSIVSTCMKNASGARQCIINGMDTVQRELDTKQSVFRKNVESTIQTVNECVDGNEKSISESLDDAIANYNNCITE